MNSDEMFAGLDEDFDFDDASVEAQPKEEKKEVKKETKKEENKVVSLEGKGKKAGAVSTPQTTLTPSQVGSLSATGVAKLVAIYKEMTNTFVEREEIIKDMLRALAIGSNAFLYGEPGTGKSAMTYDLCGRIVGGVYFQWMLNRTSDPSEILGPISLSAMEQDKFLRKTSGKLPEAHISFIDEIFKANEPILNILLPLLNERIFYNDGKPNNVPTIAVFSASNEFPEDTALMALYDRFLFRENVEYIKDPSNVVKMQEMYVDGKNPTIQSNTVKTTITIDELTAIRETAKTITCCKQVLNTLSKLYITLANKGIVISDRRKNECLKVLQGNAVFHNRGTVNLDDFNALKNVLWNDLKEIPLVEEELVKLVNPYDNKINSILKKFNEVKNNIDKTQDDTDKTTMVVEAKPHIEGFISKIDSIIKEASKNGKDVSKYQHSRDNINTYYENMLKKTLGLNLGTNDTADDMSGIQF